MTQLMENDLEKRQIIFDAFRKGQNRCQARDRIVERFGNCVGYGERTCDRWIKKFKSGDFDLIAKPRDRSTTANKDRTYSKRKKTTKKNTTSNEVAMAQQQDLPISMSKTKNQILEDLFQKKRELTISKVRSKNSAAVQQLTVPPNITTKKLIPCPGPPKLTPVFKMTPTKNMNTSQLEMPKLRPRRRRSQDIELQLPVSAAKRLTPHTMTENHSIGEENRNSPRSASTRNFSTRHSGSKQVTVQFENISPEIAKNTVCKSSRVSNSPSNHLKPQNPITQADKMLKISKVAHIASMSPEKSKTLKPTAKDMSSRRLAPQPLASPPSQLNNPKGIIYLNPQEIFRQSFGGFGNVNLPTQRPKPVQPKLPKPAATLPSPLSSAPQEKNQSVELSDSDDTEDDLVLPKNVPLPAPKIKTDTFTTYFDMENGDPIPLNEAKQPILPKAATTVIEID